MEGWKPWQLWIQPGSATEPNVHIVKPDILQHMCVRVYISTTYVRLYCVRLPFVCLTQWNDGTFAAAGNVDSCCLEKHVPVTIVDSPPPSCVVTAVCVLAL